MKSTIEKVISIEEELLHHYSPDQLTDIFDLYCRQFLADTPSLFSEWNLNEKEFSGLTVRVREIVRLIAIICSGEELFQSWYQQLPYMVSKVLETITWESKQELGELDQRTKGNIQFKVVNNQFNRETLNPAYCLFYLFRLPKDKQKGEYLYYFDLPVSLRRKLKTYLPKPKGYELKPIKAPKNTRYEFADQQKILHLFPLILEYIQQGNLELTKTGSPKKSAVTRLLKFAEIDEFYPEISDSHLKSIRMERLVHLCLLSPPSSPQQEAKQHLKAMVSQLEKQEDDLLIPLVTHLKGWHQITERFNTLRDIIRLLKELPINRWISIHQLRRFSHLHDLRLSPVDEKTAAENLYLPLNWQGWGHTRKLISPDLFQKTLTDPWLKSALGLFATLGILDLKYDSPTNTFEIEGYQHPYLTAFDGLRYVRLTDLGAYCLSLSEDFQASCDSEITTDITADEDRLILSLSRTDAAISMKLETIAHRIGARLFKVDHSSFLSGCLDQAEVQSRILMLRDLVTAPLPALWEVFFQELIGKLNLIDPVTNAILLKLDPNAGGLIDHITNDPELRQLVQLAEDFHIIVKKEDLNIFRQKLRNFGYLF